MSRNNIPSKPSSGFLFISGGVYRRIPLFQEPAVARIFLETLESYRTKYELLVHAYSVMPDHYHLLIWFPEGLALRAFLRDFKSLAGKMILEWLSNSDPLLMRRFLVSNAPRRKKDSRYCILQHGNYVKALRDLRAAISVVNYIHLNAVKAGLAAREELYAFSSAPFYTANGKSLVTLDWIESKSSPPPGGSLGARR
jgi:REP element-mobilizing transposase RayT